MKTDPSDGEAPGASPSVLTRAVNALVWACGALSTVMILFTLAVVIYAIVQRYVLNTPLLWGDELIGYVLVATIMFGAAEALHRNDHIAIDLLSSRVGPRTATILSLWADLAVIAFAVVLGWSTWEAVTFAYDFGSYSSGYIEIATWIPQSPMLLGAALLGLTALTRLLETLTGGRS